MAKSKDRYAVVGNPVAHSKSPIIHALFARTTGQAISYEAVLVEIGRFPAAVDTFRAQGGRGLNVTVPFKQEAWQYVDKLSDRAELAGAVNTIVFQSRHDCYGDNTDGVGLVRDLTVNLAFALEGHRLLVLGAGGAVRGIVQPLLEKSPAELIIANRTVERAQGLADHFAEFGHVGALGFDELFNEPFDLIVNATAAGLSESVPDIPASVIAPGACCYDLMYGNETTAFTRWAKRHGASKVADGLGMLVEQAAESFAIWRGVRPETAPVIKALRGEQADFDVPQFGVTG